VSDYWELRDRVQALVPRSLLLDRPKTRNTDMVQSGGAAGSVSSASPQTAPVKPKPTKKGKDRGELF